ncbi:MAG: hypothetical protein Q8L48_16680 [Archangium sp.]|nr:hypothetical protein [Archangium sp.]
MSDPIATALAGLNLTPEQTALLGKGLLALGEALTQSAVHKAEVAGKAAADAITTADQAEEAARNRR